MDSYKLDLSPFLPPRKLDLSPFLPFLPPRGWLSRMQFLDIASGDVTHEHYLRPDGSVALIRWFARDGQQRQLAKIQLLDRRGFCVQEFGSQAELIACWLRSITSEVERRYVMIVDRNRVFAEPLRALKNSPEYQNNVVVMPVIHAVHTKDAFDIKHSRTNGNYASILENLKPADAVVVATKVLWSTCIAAVRSGF